MVHKLYTGQPAPVSEDGGPGTLSADFLLDVVSRLSHDLRTPLGAILGFTDLLLDGAGGSLTGEQRRHLREIRRGGDRILEMLNHCLRQVETGKPR